MPAAAQLLIRGRAALKQMVPPRLLPGLLDGYYRLRAASYRGDRVACPVCGGRFRAFIPFVTRGGRSIPGQICPRCSTHPRHRLLWLYLERRLAIGTQPLRLLHFAPEHALQSRLAALPAVRYLGVDLASPLAAARMDITALGLRDASFDLVLCNHVLEHVRDDRRALAEIRRVLAPAGRAILQVPLDRSGPTREDPAVVDPMERERRYGQYDHLRMYGSDYAERLAGAGFAVTVDGFVRELDAAAAERLGLDRDEDVYLVCKR